MAVPLVKKSYDVEIENEPESSDEITTWHWWRKMRTLCEENSRLGVALELTADLPSDFEIDRWFAEPIRALIIPTSLFLTNKSGFPVLSKPHQKFVEKFFNVGRFFYVLLVLVIR